MFLVLKVLLFLINVSRQFEFTVHLNRRWLKILVLKRDEAEKSNFSISREALLTNPGWHQGLRESARLALRATGSLRSH